MVQQAVDEIIHQETENDKLIVKSETHAYENTDRRIDIKELYEIYKSSLD